MFQLVRLDTNEVIELGDNSISIGRKEDMCEIVVDEHSISGLHCRIVVSRDEDSGDVTCVMVYDLGSRNGTWVNGKRVPSAELNCGDELRLGRVKMTFGYATVAEPQPTQFDVGAKTTAMQDTAYGSRAKTSFGQMVASKVREMPSSKSTSEGFSDINEPDANDEYGAQEDSGRGTGVMIEINMGGAAVGPFSVSAVADAVAKREIKPNTMARMSGARNWTSVSSLLRVLDASNKSPAGPLDRPTPVPQSRYSSGGTAVATAPVMTVTSPRRDTGTDPEIPVSAPSPAVHTMKRPVSRPSTSTSKAAPSSAREAGNRPAMIGTITAMLCLVGIVSWVYSGDTGGRRGIYGDIEHSGNGKGRISFRPTSDQKLPVAITEIKGGMYAFSDANGPMPGTYDVEIEIDQPAEDSASREGDGPKRVQSEGPFAGFAGRPPKIGRARITVASNGDRKLDLSFNEVPAGASN